MQKLTQSNAYYGWMWLPGRAVYGQTSLRRDEWNHTPGLDRHPPEGMITVYHGRTASGARFEPDTSIVITRCTSSTLDAYIFERLQMTTNVRCWLSCVVTRSANETIVVWVTLALVPRHGYRFWVSISQANGVRSSIPTRCITTVAIPATAVRCTAMKSPAMVVSTH